MDIETDSGTYRINYRQEPALKEAVDVYDTLRRKGVTPHEAMGYAIVEFINENDRQTAKRVAEDAMVAARVNAHVGLRRVK